MLELLVNLTKKRQINKQLYLSVNFFSLHKTAKINIHQEIRFILPPNVDTAVIKRYPVFGSINMIDLQITVSI
jgi:hypothetical protein